MAKKYFIITIDTEMDGAWDRPTKVSLNNLKMIPRFQDLCDKYGILPTYLLAYECTNNDFAREIFRPIIDSGKAEFGHHLHSWTTPPFERDNGYGIDLAWDCSYQFELPDDLFYEKSKSLKNSIFDSYGVIPTSHRAGRWGIDKRTLRWLNKNNFVVDTSVVPFINNQGKSIQKLPNKILDRIYPSKIDVNENSFILEIPVSISLPYLLSFYYSPYLSRLFNTKAFHKMLNKLGYGKILRPRPDESQSSNVNLLKNIIGQNGQVINFMLHSSELMLKGSPYTMKAKYHKNYWVILEEIFKFIRKNNIIPIHLSEYARKLTSK